MEFNRSVTEYFRDALMVQNQGTIDFKNNGKNYSIISGSTFDRGMVGAESLQFIKYKFNEKKVEYVNIIIVAKTIISEFKTGEKSDTNLKELTGVFYIPAMVNREGRLFPGIDEGKMPWIPREFLQPMLDPQISLGEVGDVDDFLESTTGERVHIQRWDEYVAYCKKYFNTITKSEFYSVTDNNGVQIYEDKMYIMLDELIQATYHIKNLYKGILQDEEEKPLYNNFTKVQVKKSLPLISNVSIDFMQQHQGQMGGAYPLADSQRDAVNQFNRDSKGDILAVSGPPGTGKTTLLQSIVADMYVKSAIAEDAPPVIVASSTNNQAVTNIIDSFGNVERIGISDIEKRWVKGVESFALYFPSLGKVSEAVNKGYQYTNSRWEGFASYIENEDRLNESKEMFIKECNQYFGIDKTNIKECKEVILCELREIDRLRYLVLEQLKKIMEISESNNTISYVIKLKTMSQNLVDEINHLNTLVSEFENNISMLQLRKEEWRNIYQEVKKDLKKGHFFSPKQSLINAELIKMRSQEEMNFLKDQFDIYDILRTYDQKQKIESDNLEKTKDKQKKILNEKDLLLEKVNVMTEYLNKMFEYLIKLKDKKCDIWFTQDKSKAEQHKNHVDEILRQVNEVEINRLLDTHVRYIEFWLAIHYFESRFLFGEYSLTEKQKNKEWKNIFENRFRRMALLTPCMVMTFYMMPKNFNVKIKDGNQEKKTYMYNFIDLLIVDEAGQVTPEVAAASFSLAKKALIVGDEEQIPPVWGVQRGLDITLAIKNGVINNKHQFEELEETGHNCSESSVMRIAKNVSNYEILDEAGSQFCKGLFLKEHRRCYNEIIEYSNRLVYRGNLLPCRGSGKDDSEFPLKNYPHMGHYNISTEQSKRRGTSRCSEEEAEKIALWLSKNYNLICSAYSDTEKNKVLAVITPFKAQVTVLRGMIRQYLRNESRNIDIGTVHTFQGGERKIIIMSTVYGNQDGCYFINSNKQLMNVAVSRAKDAFWVFGSYGCLDQQTEDTASGILKRNLTCFV